MRSFGIDFHMAQLIEREEAGPEARSKRAITKGLESGGKTVRCC